jgi:uncharacterized protein (TIGR02588 family)
MKAEKNALEWTVFAVSLLLIAAVVGALVLEAARSHDTPPVLRIHTGTATEAAGAWRVPVAITNEGDTTAEGARIEVTLENGGREVERAELTIAFIPRKSKREGWVTFRHDPRCCEVLARATGFENP